MIVLIQIITPQRAHQRGRYHTGPRYPHFLPYYLDLIDFIFTIEKLFVLVIRSWLNLIIILVRIWIWIRLRLPRRKYVLESVVYNLLLSLDFLLLNVRLWAHDVFYSVVDLVLLPKADSEVVYELFHFHFEEQLLVDVRMTVRMPVAVGIFFRLRMSFMSVAVGFFWRLRLTMTMAVSFFYGLGLLMPMSMSFLHSLRFLMSMAVSCFHRLLVPSMSVAFRFPNLLRHLIFIPIIRILLRNRHRLMLIPYLINIKVKRPQSL